MALARAKETSLWNWEEIPANKTYFEFEKFSYSGITGPNAFDNDEVKTALNFYSVFSIDEFLKVITDETNRYTEQKITGIVSEGNYH